MKISRKKIIFVGDVHGRLKLLKKIVSMYPNYLIILLGDLQDRGPNSKELLDFIINNKNIIAIKGNHEELFEGFMEEDFNSDWISFLANGGIETISSYLPKNKKVKVINKLYEIEFFFSEYYQTDEFKYEENPFIKSNYYKNNIKLIKKYISYLNKIKKDFIPKRYINFIKNLPLYFKGDNWIATHAPVFEDSLEESLQTKTESEFLWNRFVPVFEKNVNQFYGHNGYYREKIFKNGTSLICVDDSKNNNLCGYNLWKKQKVLIEGEV